MASSSRPNPPPSRRPSRGLLDVTNVNINNSEIDKVTINIQRKVKVKKISGLRPVHPLGSSASTRCHGRHCCSWGPWQGGIRGTKIQKHKYKNKQNTNTNTLRYIAVWVGCCKFKCQDWCLTVSVTLEGLGGVCLSECLCVWGVSQWV